MHKNSFSNFYLKLDINHLYPTEWIIRSLLGNYPQHESRRSEFIDKKLLDVGFGDGRNFPLFMNCGFNISGVEVDQHTIDLTQKKFTDIDVELELKVGSNSSIPFADNSFDYIVSSFAMYYMDQNSQMHDVVKEYKRVLKPSGEIYTTIAHIDTFVYKNAEEIHENHFLIKNDKFNLRNGQVLYAAKNESDVLDLFNNDFEHISIGSSFNNYYGLPISYFMVIVS